MIASLKLQPILLVVRPQPQDCLDPSNALIPLLDPLYQAGLRHLELAWIDHPSWPDLVRSLQSHFPLFHLGMASVVESRAIDVAVNVDLSYAMSPVWDPELQHQARMQGLPLVPGVFSPTEVLQAKASGCRVVKLFPAATLGPRYWSRLQAPLGGLPFVIAAGGLTLNDVDPWLQAGHGAVALGRSVINASGVGADLLHWLERSTIHS